MDKQASGQTHMFRPQPGRLGAQRGPRGQDFSARSRWWGNRGTGVTMPPGTWIMPQSFGSKATHAAKALGTSEEVPDLGSDPGAAP